MKKTNLRTRIASVGILTLLGYTLVGGEQNFLNYWKVSRKESNLRREFALGEAKRHKLAERSYRLKNDRRYIEKIAREQFNMGKQGEKVFLITSRKR